ncbi:MAG: extracellular solute-binding protein [Phycisphaerales bacterium]|nr:extracellular solute-binding protein [Phycisphaerales bacterium]
MNRRAAVIVGICLAILLGVPLFFRSDRRPQFENAPRVIIITPHNEQIRREFAGGFAIWHENRYGEAAEVVWSVPGGTSEIRRMLVSQYQHARESGEALGGDADLVFGGGSYEHGVLKDGGITVPGGLSQERLDDLYGENSVGAMTLYDPDGYWYGTALSGFGIVSNTEVLADLGLEPPMGWEDLCDPRLVGRLALVNPAQSGSVTTAFEAILQNLGWTRGWQVLRRAAANARYFSASSLKPPADVSQGDAAMGVCIDFYGRYQSQAIQSHGGGDRIAYIDPPGATMIDPDPISMLLGAPNQEMAHRFIEFTLSQEGQALWQFRADDEGAPDLGPQEFELRRMPVRRAMYEWHMPRMVDQVNPFDTAREPPFAERSMRAFIAPIFSAMAMDHHDALVEAWRAIISHPAYPEGGGIVTAGDVDDWVLKAMLEDFDAMPSFATPDGSTLAMDTAENRAMLKKGWLRNGWSDTGLWHREDGGSSAMRRTAASFYEDQYNDIVESFEQ